MPSKPEDPAGPCPLRNEDCAVLTESAGDLI